MGDERKIVGEDCAETALFVLIVQQYDGYNSCALYPSYCCTIRTKSAVSAQSSPTIFRSSPIDFSSPCNTKGARFSLGALFSCGFVGGKSFYRLPIPPAVIPFIPEAIHAVVTVWSVISVRAVHRSNINRR